MLESALGVLGILVSILFFFVGYRQTVGAKKERIAACNSDVERILVRRIVLEGYQPGRSDLTRLIDGKARDFRVRSGDLLSEGQIMNTVYTRVVESDLIPADKRVEILGRIMRSVLDAEASPVEEERVGEGDVTSKATVALAVLGGVASVVGGLVTTLPEIANLDTDYPTLFRTAALTAGVSIGLIATWIVWYRFRASQEALSSKAGEREYYLRFEHDVLNVLRRLRVSVRPTKAAEGGDFIVQAGGKKIVVEVKAWARPVPQRVLAEVAERTRRAAQQSGSTEAVLVVPSTDGWEVSPEALHEVKLFGLDEFREYIRGQATAA